MAREAVRDIDEIAERLMEAGLLKFRLRGSFIPITGVDHRRRRAYGLE